MKCAQLWSIIFCFPFFQMPVDINTLSEEDRQIRLAKRKPKEKIIIAEEIEDSYDINQYAHMWKKK